MARSAWREERRAERMAHRADDRAQMADDREHGAKGVQLISDCKLWNQDFGLRIWDFFLLAFYG